MVTNSEKPTLITLDPYCTGLVKLPKRGKDGVSADDHTRYHHVKHIASVRHLRQIWDKIRDESGDTGLHNSMIAYNGHNITYDKFVIDTPDKVTTLFKRLKKEEKDQTYRPKNSGKHKHIKAIHPYILRLKPSQKSLEGADNKNHLSGMKTRIKDAKFVTNYLVFAPSIDHESYSLKRELHRAATKGMAIYALAHPWLDKTLVNAFKKAKAREDKPAWAQIRWNIISPNQCDFGDPNAAQACLFE